MASDSFQTELPQTLEEAFPQVDAGVLPMGPRILVQLRRVANVTKSGIVLIEETKETVKWNGQVAKVIAMGPIAFKDRETAVEWPEGAWVAEGEFIRCPRWGGDRIEVPVKAKDGSDAEPVTFVIFNDHEVIAKVTGDPLAQRAYIL